MAHNGEVNVFNVSNFPPKMGFKGPDRLPLIFDWPA